MTVEHRMVNDHWCTFCQGVNAHNCQFNKNIPRIKTYISNTSAPESTLTWEAHKALVEQAVRAERDACARVCDERVKGYQYETDIYASEHINEAKQCAAAIRARGE